MSPSPSEPITKEDLTHRVCHWLKSEYDEHGECAKCPLTIDTPYGKGSQFCVMRAQEIIEIVRSSP